MYIRYRIIKTIPLYSIKNNFLYIMYMDEINKENDNLTAKQRACKKYYLKMKNDPEFIKNAMTELKINV